MTIKILFTILIWFLTYIPLILVSAFVVPIMLHFGWQGYTTLFGNRPLRRAIRLCLGSAHGLRNSPRPMFRGALGLEAGRQAVGRRMHLRLPGESVQEVRVTRHHHK